MCIVEPTIRDYFTVPSAIGPPGPDLLASGAKARKSLNQASLDWFPRRLEPRPQSHKIELPGIGFVDFLSQGQKVIKSTLLGLVLLTP